MFAPIMFGLYILTEYLSVKLEFVKSSADWIVTFSTCGGWKLKTRTAVPAPRIIRATISATIFFITYLPWDCNDLLEASPVIIVSLYMYLTDTAKQFRLTTYQKSSKRLFETLPELMPRTHCVTRCNNDYTLFHTSHEANTHDLFPLLWRQHRTA